MTSDRAMPEQSSLGSQRGFSLLETVVAIAILGIALGGLYSAASGATRNVRADERYAYAVELGRSLLADHNQIPRSGVRDSGVTAGGFNWQVSSRPAPLGRSGLDPGALQEIQVTVSWADGLKDRSIRLDSVVEGVAGEEQF